MNAPPPHRTPIDWAQTDTALPAGGVESTLPLFSAGTYPGQMGLLGWDERLFRILNHRGIPSIDPLGMLLSDGRFWWFAAAAITLGLLVIGCRRKLISVWLLLLVGLGFSDAVRTYALKPSFQRPRPCHVLTEVRLVAPVCGSPWGFPSNHAGNSAAIATVVALSFTSRWRWLVAGLAFLVGLSRIYLGVHYPGDIVAGFMVGGVVGWLVTRLPRILFKPKPAI